VMTVMIPRPPIHRCSGDQTVLPQAPRGWGFNCPGTCVGSRNFLRCWLGVLQDGSIRLLGATIRTRQEGLLLEACACCC